jgi:hypothetical protein
MERNKQRNDGKGGPVEKRPTNENKDLKSQARQPTNRQQTRSKDVRIANVLVRLLDVATRFEAQLRNVGVTPDSWEQTRDAAKRFSDALNAKDKVFPNNDLSLLDEEHRRFVGPFEVLRIVIPEAAAQLEPRADTTVGSSLTVGTEVLPSVAPMERFEHSYNDDGGFDPGYDDRIDNPSPELVSPSPTRTFVLDKGKRRANEENEDEQEEQLPISQPVAGFDYDYYGPEPDEGFMGLYPASISVSARKNSVGSSSSRPINDTPPPPKKIKSTNESVKEVKPARKEMESYFRTMGHPDDLVADRVRSNNYTFVYPKRFEYRNSKEGIREDGQHEYDFEWVQTALYDVARETLSRRNVFENPKRDRNNDPEWSTFETNVVDVWKHQHFGRWGDRDKWNYPESTQIGNILPRFFARPESLMDLEVRYFTENKFKFESIRPYKDRRPPAVYPIAFDPYVRLHFKTPNGRIMWTAPTDNDEAKYFFLDNGNHPSFAEFASIQTPDHPIHRATLVRVDNFGEILAGLFRFLAYYRINFGNGEGVLLRQDARILWSQTSEAYTGKFRPPTLIFRIGLFHFAWWHASIRTGNHAVQGTARIYCLEADRWVGFFGNPLSSDYTTRNDSKRPR